MGIIDKIKEIEAEMARTQKNKATNYHLGTLKAKIAKLRTQLMEGPKGTAKTGEGFDVMKSGDARVAMIGFPSVGKSSALAELTNTSSTAAAYEFTTLTCIPGVIDYKEAKIQLLDLPGIIEGAAKGKGRGRQVIAVGRTSDLIMMVLDAEKAELQKRLLTAELESVGIRLNKRIPDVTFRQKKTGGVSVSVMCDLKSIDEETVRRVMQEYRIFNADILFREDCTIDEFIDLVEGNRKYLRCLYVVNKADCINLLEVDRLARLPDTICVSIKQKLNLDNLLAKLWEYLNIIRVYTKPRGKRPDFHEPLILRSGSTIEHTCHAIHRDLTKRFKYALVWGTSAKHMPQRVGIAHKVQDEDVVQVMAK